MLGRIVFLGFRVQIGGNVQGFKIFKVILYVKYTKYGVSKTQAPQPPALLGFGVRVNRV